MNIGVEICIENKFIDVYSLTNSATCATLTSLFGYLGCPERNGR